MIPTPRLFRRLMLMSLFLGLVQWALASLLPDSVPEILRVADEKATEEIGKSFAAGISPALAISFSLGTIAGILAFLGATVASFIGLFMFKWWARRLALVIVLIAVLLTPFINYFLLSGLEWAFADLQGLLWGAILSMAYFSPVSQCFARNVR